MITDDELRAVAGRLRAIVDKGYTPDWPCFCRAVLGDGCETYKRARLESLSVLADMVDPGPYCDRAALLELAGRLSAAPGHFAAKNQRTCSIDVLGEIGDAIRDALGVVR